MMIRKEKHIHQRIVVLVTRTEDEHKLCKTLEGLHMPIIYYQFRGQGTASSELLDIIGLRGTGRIVTLCVLPHKLVGEVFSALNRDLSLEKKGGGIAVSIPVTGLPDALQQMLTEEHGAGQQEQKGEEKQMNTSVAYSMILVAANYGYSDEIIDAARSAGARGGTVLKGRRRGEENIMHYLGLSLQEEQELTMIVVPQEKKAAVMVAVSQACGLRTEAHGVVLSVPVDEVMGLE